MQASSVFLWQFISWHNYFVSEHFASLGHNMPVHCQIKFFTAQIASLDMKKNGKIKTNKSEGIYASNCISLKSFVPDQ